LEKRVADLTEEIRNRAAQMEALQSEKNALAAANTALKAELEKLSLEATGSLAATTGAQASAASGPGKEGSDVRLARIHDAYLQYTAREDSLLKAQGEEGLLEAKLYLDRFFASPGVEELFPRLWNRVKKYDSAFEKAGRTGGLQEAADIVAAVLSQKSPEGRQRVLEREITRYRKDEIMSAFLAELKRYLKS